MKTSLCMNCYKTISIKSKYCSNKCQRDYEYHTFINKWKNGIVNGSKSNGDEISNFIRKYLFIKFNNSCSSCGFDKVNPFSNRSVLEVEHINGNPNDNSENNLTLLCPNCHSLTSTFRALNKGNGRKHRRNNIKKSILN